ncbi:SnoaL-like protein [Pontibacter ummariensis]|uniref:SnoaL-like domain-containing protein n=1 Tax=Pontibacter ummariensis TaxID=1610492 RepID=A0A239L9K6_9BACT|nr:nuclear transport factor 2 family protein [Pontibacter ummariensis]PRY03967.1 SnoaL-like protein [Pontibacter ummariensis]SNT27141.1 SnoaL-like domain-containing protein [Pontibacter ummariensis]
MEVLAEDRVATLHRIVRAYVAEGLAKGNFDAIPYHEAVELRAPLCPGGSAVPLKGREQLREVWWKPLPDLVEACEVVDSFVNTEQTAAAVEFYCYLRAPKVKLRIMDRFQIDEQGRITAQENFFDPRDVTHPGWQQ